MFDVVWKLVVSVFPAVFRMLVVQHLGIVIEARGRLRLSVGKTFPGHHETTRFIASRDWHDASSFLYFVA